MKDELFFGGVSLLELNSRLGEPLQSGPRGGQEISVRVTHRVGDVVYEVEPPDRETITWDCLAFEKTFRAVHEVAARASEQDAEFIVQALSTASQMHLLSQCRAEQVGEDRWTLTYLCLKHLCERSAWMAERGGHDAGGS